MDIRNGTEAITTKPTDFKRRAREYSEQLSVQLLVNTVKPSLIEHTRIVFLKFKYA